MVKDQNSTNLKSRNSQELTTEEMKSIRAKGWVDDFTHVFNTIVNGAVHILESGLPGGGFSLNYTSNNTTTSVQTSGHFHL